MKTERFSIVVTGDIDHGKSTLVGRILVETGAFPKNKLTEIKDVCTALGKPFEYAFVTDAFEEERTKGFTLDTTQIQFAFKKKQYLIIDTPGHKEFIKNMITGASQAEAAILIVDAERGIGDQTQLHSLLLKMIGIKHIFVAVNKMDKFQFSETVYQKVRKSIEDFFLRIGLHMRAIIPISAGLGENIFQKSTLIPWYKGASLLEELELYRSDIESAPSCLIFPIQDMYDVHGQKIAVGRIESGTLKKDGVLSLFPGGKKITIRTIETFPQQKSFAGAGEAIGVTFVENFKIERGMILSDSLLETSLTIKANIFWISPQQLDINKTYTIALTTQKSSCHVSNIHYKLDCKLLKKKTDTLSTLKYADLGNVTLSLQSPLITALHKNPSALHQFVLEDHDTICGVGMVENVYI